MKSENEEREYAPTLPFSFLPQVSKKKCGSDIFANGAGGRKPHALMKILTVFKK